MKPKQRSSVDFVFYTIIVAVILYISYVLAYSMYVTKAHSNTFELSIFLNSFTSGFEHPNFKAMYNPYTLKIIGMVSLFIISWFMYKKLNPKKDITDISNGSAEWGNPKRDLNEVMVKKFGGVYAHTMDLVKKEYKSNIRVVKKDLKGKQKKDELVLRKKNFLTTKAYYNDLLHRNNIELILSREIKFSIFNYLTNSNVIILGGSGSGKTRYEIMPDILNLAGTSSFCIIDPKGEVYQKSRYFLEKVKGYKVKTLNLMDTFKSNGFNPFHYIHIDWENYDWQKDVLDIIDAMIVNMDGGEGRKSTDAFWEDAPKMLIQALFFIICYAFKEEQRNMGTFMELLHMLELAEDKDDLDCPLDRLFRWFVADEKEGGAGFSEKNIAYATYKDFRTKAGGKTAKNIAVIVLSKFQTFNLDSMQYITANDEMEIERVGEELTATFVIVPPTSKTFNFMAGIYFNILFREINYSANSLHNGRLPIPFVFLGDELANTCVITNLPQFIAYARSLGVSILPVLQSQEQLKAMYEKEYKIILDNCATTVFLGSVESEETLKNISEMKLGKGTFDVTDISETRGRQKSYSVSRKKVGRELMMNSELMQLDPKDCLVFVKGKKPFYCKKYDYISHRNYKYTSDFNKDYIRLMDELDRKKAEYKKLIKQYENSLINDKEQYKKKVNDLLNIYLEGTDVDRSDSDKEAVVNLQLSSLQIANDNISDADGVILSSNMLLDDFMAEVDYTKIYENSREDIEDDISIAIFNQVMEYKEEINSKMEKVATDMFSENKNFNMDTINHIENKTISLASDYITSNMNFLEQVIEDESSNEFFDDDEELEVVEDNVEDDLENIRGIEFEEEIEEDFGEEDLEEN